MSVQFREGSGHMVETLQDRTIVNVSHTISTSKGRTVRLQAVQCSKVGVGLETVWW